MHEDSLFRYITEILTNFITVSRSKRLRIFDQYKKNNTVISTSRSFPLISTQMGSFFGFLDEGFRTYDFYIGMLDAWMFLEDFQAREKTKLISSVRDNEKWWPFKCLRILCLLKNIQTNAII